MANQSDDDPQSPADLERMWQHRKTAEDAEFDRVLTREERLDALCTWGFGALAILGVWKAFDLFIAFLWLLSL